MGRFGWFGGEDGAGDAGDELLAGAAGVELVRGQAAEDGDAGCGGGDGSIHGVGLLIFGQKMPRAAAGL